MLGHTLLKLTVSASMLLAAGSAFAENRLALVIGQSAYRSVPALPNPANDAKAVTQMLTDSGFEVSTAADLSQNEMRQQVSEFAGKVAAKGPTPSRWYFMPAMVCRSTARIIWSPSMSIRSAKPTFRSRRCASTTS